ncbi:MAG: preprotein translocase subunit SecE [Candidatus Kerfeldbacteria bacterium]|nr:preprotein translocase subunit SecE [Candidatus Kerfeldbacteria bacterium]
MANRLTRYIGESREELRKVVWPTRRETTSHTFMVIAISLAVAAFLGLVDFVLNSLFENFLI